MKIFLIQFTTLFTKANKAMSAVRISMSACRFDEEIFNVLLSQNTAESGALATRGTLNDPDHVSIQSVLF